MHYVLYHANCLDGLGAKYAAWTVLGEAATYKAVQYDSDVPDYPYTQDDTVYILDFSYPREALMALHEKVGRLVVLDHHASAAKALAGLDFAVFDMNRSGATIAWEFFHPGEPCPILLQLLEDRDLRRFKNDLTRPITAALYSKAIWQEMAFMDALRKSTEYACQNKVAKCAETEVLVEVLSHGLVLLEIERGVIDSFIAKQKYTVRRYEGYSVVLYNTTSLISELGEALCKHTGADVSMSYFINNEGKVIFSFRSSPDGPNVSILAEQLGGGGHEHSAGASLTSPKGFVTLAELYALPELC